MPAALTACFDDRVAPLYQLTDEQLTLRIASYLGWEFCQKARTRRGRKSEYKTPHCRHGRHTSGIWRRLSRLTFDYAYGVSLDHVGQAATALLAPDLLDSFYPREIKAVLGELSGFAEDRCGYTNAGDTFWRAPARVRAIALLRVITYFAHRFPVPSVISDVELRDAT